MYMAVPWVTPIKDDAIRCEATVFVSDDRWGGWTNRCQLRKGHGGYHRHPLDACDPLAFMAWTGTKVLEVDPSLRGTCVCQHSLDAHTIWADDGIHGGGFLCRLCRDCDGYELGLDPDVWDGYRAECEEFGCHDTTADLSSRYERDQ